MKMNSLPMTVQNKKQHHVVKSMNTATLKKKSMYQRTDLDSPRSVIKIDKPLNFDQCHKKTVSQDAYDEKIFKKKLSVASFRKSKFMQSPHPERRPSVLTVNTYTEKSLSITEDKNVVQMLKTYRENIKDKEEQSKKTIQLKVSARFRPYNQLELDLRKEGEITMYQIVSDKTISFSRLHDTCFFTFDHIFDVNATQEEVYREVGKESIDEVLKGYNGTIFTYGQSGSGKTFTMYGNDINDPDSKGIIPRALDHIFDFIDDENNKSIKFEIKFSLLEIYKERLYDLLNPQVDSDQVSEKRKLKIKDCANKGIYVQNLTEEYITDLDEFFDMLEEAEKYRVVSETFLNKTSSRSHLLMKLDITQKFPDGLEKKGILNLVDLAGSEKVSKTGASGETLEEAKKINLSLSALGKVISDLSSGHEGGFVPYRDSKLTRILQDSLGGNFKTSLIVTCSPHIYNSDENFSTLNFAQRAKRIKTIVGMNVKRSPEELENIIKHLNEELKNIKNEFFTFVNGENEIKIRNSLNLSHGLSNGLTQGLSQRLINHSDDESIMSENTVTPKIVNTNSNDSVNLNVKVQIEEIKQLKEENENLKNEIKKLKSKLDYYAKEFNENKVIKELENLVKTHIEELKKLKEFESNLDVKNLTEENKALKKKLEESKQNKNYDNNPNFLIFDEFQYANSDLFFNDKSVFDIGKKLQKFNSHLKEIHNKIKSISNSSIKVDKLEGVNNLSEEFESYTSAYDNIFTNTKLYMNKIMEDFLKKNLFDKDFFGKDESKLKNSFMNLSILNISYERVLINFMDKILLDVKKFCLGEFLKNEQNNLLDSMLNLFDYYMDCLQYVKSIKFKEERISFVVRDSFNKIPKGNLTKPVRRRRSLGKNKNKLNFEGNNLKGNNVTSLIINDASLNLEKMKNDKEQLYTSNSIEEPAAESESDSEKENDVKLPSLKKRSTISEAPEEDDTSVRNESKNFIFTRSRKRNDSIKHRKQLFNEAYNSQSNMPSININYASSTTLNNNINNNNSCTPLHLALKKDSYMDVCSSEMSPINAKSFVNAPNYNYNNNYEYTLKAIKKELNMYNIYAHTQQREILKLKAGNSALENTLKEYKSSLPDDMDSFSKSFAVLKSLYDEELKNKNNKIELLSMTIDEILLNKGPNNFDNALVLKNYFDKRKQAILNDNDEGNDIQSIAEAYIKESGSATKRMDYISFHGDLSSRQSVKIDFGTGLQSTFPGVSPLQRNLRQSLRGDDSMGDYVDSCEEVD